MRPAIGIANKRAKHWLFCAVEPLNVNPMKIRHLLPGLLAAFALAGCLHVKTDPIEVKPIHITVDVNVKVDKALDDFFGDLDKKSSTITVPPATP